MVNWPYLKLWRLRYRERERTYAEEARLRARWAYINQHKRLGGCHARCRRVGIGHFVDQRLLKKKGLAP